jgi:hypothetical protein
MTFPGAVQVRGGFKTTSASVTVQISGTLTLQNGAVLENPGTIRVGAFVNNGGTIIGNAPIVGAGDLRIEAISLVSAQGDPSLEGLGETPAASVVLRWRGQPGGAFVVEGSPDMRSWSSVSAVIQETPPGFYSGTLSKAAGENRFFRLMVVEEAGGEAETGTAVTRDPPPSRSQSSSSSRDQQPSR